MTNPVFPEALRVNVTADDIARGRRLNVRRCPIALAVRRLGLRGVTVCMEIVAERRTGAWAEYRLPAEAIAFLDKYDNARGYGHGDVAPLEFTARLSDSGMAEAPTL